MQYFCYYSRFVFICVFQLLQIYLTVSSKQTPCSSCRCLSFLLSVILVSVEEFRLLPISTLSQLGAVLSPQNQNCILFFCLRSVTFMMQWDYYWRIFGNLLWKSLFGTNHLERKKKLLFLKREMWLQNDGELLNCRWLFLVWLGWFILNKYSKKWCDIEIILNPKIHCCEDTAWFNLMWKSWRHCLQLTVTYSIYVWKHGGNINNNAFNSICMMMVIMFFNLFYFFILF